MDSYLITGRSAMVQTSQDKHGKIKQTIIDFLISISLFDELNSTELTIVSDYMNFFEFEKGKILFKEGDKGDYVCFIVEGGVDIIKSSVTGQKAVIATIRAGSTLGEMSIIDNIARSATAKARQDTTLVILSKKGFNTILDKHPRIGTKILKGVARLLSLNMRRTSSHLADYLLPE